MAGYQFGWHLYNIQYTVYSQAICIYVLYYYNVCSLQDLEELNRYLQPLQQDLVSWQMHKQLAQVTSPHHLATPQPPHLTISPPRLLPCRSTCVYMQVGMCLQSYIDRLQMRPYQLLKGGKFLYADAIKLAVTLRNSTNPLLTDTHSPSHHQEQSGQLDHPLKQMRGCRVGGRCQSCK